MNTEPAATEDDEPTSLKSGKATNAVILQRVEEVLLIRIDGAAFHDIRRYASENGWGVSDRQLERYIEKADKLLIERRQKKVSRLRAMHLARREALYARALQAADYRTALAVLQDHAKLTGLYPTDKPGAADGKPESVPLISITTDDDPHATAAG